MADTTEAVGRKVDEYQWLGGTRIIQLGEDHYLIDRNEVKHNENGEWVTVAQESETYREVVELLSTESARVTAECPVGAWLQSHRSADIEDLAAQRNEPYGIATCNLCCELLGEDFRGTGRVDRNGDWYGRSCEIKDRLLA